MNEDKPKIFTLFAKVFYMHKINFDYNKAVELIDEEFVLAGNRNKNDVANISLTSEDKHVLNKRKFKFLKNLVMKQINHYTKDILKYENKFEMTTSWFTKTNQGQESNYHNHTNCMLSSVLYLRTNENSGDINFTDFQTNHRFNLKNTEYNLYNAIDVTFRPEDGVILIFPSDIYHKVLKNESNFTRISLACNFIPKGDIGPIDSDSYLYLK